MLKQSSREQPAVDRIMGHAERANDMAAIYRQEAGDDTMDGRLRAVSEHVRKWYFRRRKKWRRRQWQRRRRKRVVAVVDGC